MFGALGDTLHWSFCCDVGTAFPGPFVIGVNNPVVEIVKCRDSNHPSLKKEDFMIVIQTKAQKELYQKFGSKEVCAYATYGTTSYEFLLSTLLVVDEFGHGQPVGWCLATRTRKVWKALRETVEDNEGEA